MKKRKRERDDKNVRKEEAIGNITFVCAVSQFGTTKVLLAV
jgi:hypothetical protein